MTKTSQSEKDFPDQVAQAIGNGERPKPEAEPLKPEAPKLLRQIYWLILHGKKYWWLIVLALLVVAAGRYMRSKSSLQSQSKVSRTDGQLVDVEKDYTEAERAVDDLYKEISILRGTYEAIEDSRFAATKVAEEGVKLAERMLLISKEHLDLGHRISQHQYAAYALVMASSAEKDSSRRKHLAHEADRVAQEASLLLTTAESLAGSGDDYSQKLIEWINNDQVRERNLYILAIATAITSREEDGVRNSEVLDLLEEIKHISPSYLENFPPEKNKNLRWVLVNKVKD